MQNIKNLIVLILSILKFLPYRLVEILATSPSRINTNKEVLLIKLDEIGDYILFRNFLPFIKNSNKFRGFKIILCGNYVWKDLAESLDAEYVDTFIWIDKKLFMSNLLYRYRLLRGFKSFQPDTVINCSHSRNFYIDDTLVSVSNAPNRYADMGDLSNMQLWQKKVSNKFYTKFVNTESDRFEFYKNKTFISNVISDKSYDIQLGLNTIPNTSIIIPDKYILISPGGRFKHKRWSPINFAKTAEQLSGKYLIVLTGSSQESKFAEEFSKYFSGFMDLTGKTSLLDLIPLVRNSVLLLSNDSGIVHIAAALRVRTVILHSGTHYGRFLPYPEELGIPQKVIYPPEMYGIPEGKREIIFFYRSHLDLNDISSQRVIAAIDELLL